MNEKWVYQLEFPKWLTKPEQGMSEAELKALILTYLKTAQKNVFQLIVLDEQEQMVGYMAAMDQEPFSTVYIYYVWLHKKLQHKNVFKQMLDHLIVWSRARGKTAIQGETTRHPRIYRRYGAKQISCTVSMSLK
jgi:ribosomal protein S18 acetylase RimI-like enzyme